MTVPVSLTQLGTAIEPHGGGLACVVTTLADVPAGSTIVVFTAEAANGNPVSLVDSAGNTYSAINTTTDGSTNALRVWSSVTSALLPAGGAITATWGANPPAKLMAAYALFGVVALDQTEKATPVVDVGITVVSGPLAQTGNEIALFAMVESNGQADGTLIEAATFTSLDAVFSSAALYTAWMPTTNKTPITYDPGVGVANSLIALGGIWRGAPVPPPVRRMVARIRGVPNPAPARLTISGQNIYAPNGDLFKLRGMNWDGPLAVQPDDAQIAAAMGAKVVRITIAFWFDGSGDCSTPIPNYPYEAFNPTAPGYCDPAQLAILDANVNAAVAAGLWPIITVHGADCNFGTYIEPVTGLPVVQLFGAFWAFLANRYSTTPNIAAYEIISEPHPTNNPADNSNNPATGHSSTDLGPGTGWLYNYIIPIIRAADPATPIVVGAANAYNFRTFDQIMQTIDPANLVNLIGTADWFELGTTKYRSPRRNGGYVRQTTLYPSFPNGTNYTGYPGYYYDGRGNGDNDANYPGKGTQVYMDKAWLAGASAQIVAWSRQYNIPFFYNQFGGGTGTPNMLQYTADMADVFIEQGLGFVYWAQRLKGKIPHGAGEGMIWTDPAGGYHLKNGQDPACLVMDQYGQFSGQVSTDDYYSMLTAKFAA